MRKIIIIGGALILIVALSAWAYFIYQSDPTPPEITPTGLFTFDSIEGEAASAEYLDVSGCELSPKIMRVEGGKFEARNIGLSSVDLLFVFDDFKKITILAGGSETLEFDFAEPGRYGYHCFDYPREQIPSAIPGILQVE